tara:strand:+ start:745 stop:915 length:171 start_codon:yes stop_codon:yes gene_type:complete
LTGGLIDLIGLIDIIFTILIGIETKCGMIGYGVIHMATGWDGLTVGAIIVGLVIVG